MLHLDATDSNWPVLRQEGVEERVGFLAELLVLSAAMCAPCAVGQCNARLQNGPIFLHPHISTQETRPEAVPTMFHILKANLDWPRDSWISQYHKLLELNSEHFDQLVIKFIPMGIG